MADEILEGMLTTTNKNSNISQASREESELPKLSDEQRDFMVTESVATGYLDEVISHQRRQHRPNKPGIGASNLADKAQKDSGGGFPMATSYHGNTRTNKTTGKREKYDQVKGWISTENAGITVTKTDKVMSFVEDISPAGEKDIASHEKQYGKGSGAGIRKGIKRVETDVAAARAAAVRKKRAEMHSRDPARAGGATPPRMGGLTSPKPLSKENKETLIRARNILRELTSVGAVGTADPGTTAMAGSSNRSYHQNRAQNKTAWVPETPVAPVDKALKNVGDKKVTKKAIAKALKKRLKKKNETKKDAFEKFLELVLSDMQLEDKDWIQGAEKDIERRGTKGKCTPMTKPGCTGKAMSLAKTFHKMADDRDDEVESKDEKKKKKKMKKVKSK
jgi:hypothetical protein